MSSEHRYPDVESARSALANPATPANALAAIAHRYPELSAMVVAHPHAYPDLLTWIELNAPPTGAASQLLTPGAIPPARRPARRFAALWVLAAAIVGVGAITAVAVNVLSDDTPSPVAAPTSPAIPTSPPTIATTTPPAEPVATTPTEVGRSGDDSTYCGTSGTVLAVGETERFEAVICDDAGLVYLGRSLASGNSIRLPAWVEGEGWAANNGSTVYNLTPSRLHVTDPSGTVLDESIVTWRSW